MSDDEQYSRWNDLPDGTVFHLPNGKTWYKKIDHRGATSDANSYYLANGGNPVIVIKKPAIG